MPRSCWGLGEDKIADLLDPMSKIPQKPFNLPQAISFLQFLSMLCHLWPLIPEMKWCNDTKTWACAYYWKENVPILMILGQRSSKFPLLSVAIQKVRTEVVWCWVRGCAAAKLDPWLVLTRACAESKQCELFVYDCVCRVSCAVLAFK
jgi:hypothetical protein